MKEKFYSMYGKAVDANDETHIVTVVGKYEQYTKTEDEILPTQIQINDSNNFRNGTVIFPMKKHYRKFKLSYSICHPNDEFNEDVGIRIAKSRINRGDTVGELTSRNITMLNKDQCNMLVFCELQHIIQHIDEYLPQVCENYDPDDEDCQLCPRAPHNIYGDDDEVNEIFEDKEEGDIITNNNSDDEEDFLCDDFDPENKDCQDCELAPNFDDMEDLKTEE